MFESIDTFSNAFRHESATTLKLLGVLTDQSLGQLVAPGYRSLGRIAWHIVTSQADLMQRLGLPVPGLDIESPVPATAREIAGSYESVSTHVLDSVTSQWTNDTLAVVDDMFGERWARGYSLYVMILHEAHHRGQMSVLIRQAGLELPGIAGPAKQEWAQWGMNPPVV